MSKIASLGLILLISVAHAQQTCDPEQQQDCDQTYDDAALLKIGSHKQKRFNPHCTGYMASTGCSWTFDWNCPGQPAGYWGAANNDGSIGYDCCCNEKLWNPNTRGTTTPIPPGAPLSIVDGLYTFGAVAVHGFSDYASEHSDHCFPGFRTYTENSGVGNYPDFAAALPTTQWHAITPVLVLKSEWGTDTCIYKSCSDVLEDSQYQKWPRQAIVGGLAGLAGQLLLDIHSIPYAYNPRLELCQTAQADPLVRIFADVAEVSYKTCEVILSRTCDGNATCCVGQRPPCVEIGDWKIVAKLNVSNRGDDTDLVVIVQDHTKNATGDFTGLDCGIAFTGTSSTSEFLTSLAMSYTDFCGESGVHYGIATELRWIFNAFGSVIKETLRQCKNVYSIGHSLGGGIAEAFAFCANRHDPSNADYTLIGFEKDDQPTKLDEINLTSCSGERVKNV